MYSCLKASAMPPNTQMPSHTMTPDEKPPPNDARCCCGSLLARLVPGGVELKCRRCHRLMLVPVPEGVVGAPEQVEDPAT